MNPHRFESWAIEVEGGMFYLLCPGWNCTWKLAYSCSSVRELEIRAHSHATQAHSEVPR